MIKDSARSGVGSDARSGEAEFPDFESGRKGEILAAALGVFGERGYDRGSMREIAQRVGVTEPALYRHFPGKEEIFLAVVRFMGGKVRDEGISLIESIEPEGLRDQLLHAFGDRRRAVGIYAPVVRTVLATAARNPRFLAEYRRTVIEPILVALTAKAAELDAAFATPDADATRDARVRALIALVAGYLLSSFVIGDQPDDAVADAVLRVMGWERSARASEDDRSVT